MKSFSFVLVCIVLGPITALAADGPTTDEISWSQDGTPSRESILKLLDRYHVPGISISVVDKGRIAWTRGYGVVTPGGKEISGDTRFGAGSVSKPVAAIATLRLVEQGKLKLDGELNEALKSWKIPRNEFTAKKPVTLREALAHTAGFIQPAKGWRGYEVGAPLPTLVQVLNGKPPANSPAAIVDMLPGSKFRYSNCGYLAIQQAEIDVTGETFPQMMDELVLKPLEMKCSSFEQPMPRDVEEFAAIGHDMEGKPVPGKWHIYPEMAAGGLWTTSADLARFVIAVQRAYHGEPGSILGVELCQQALTPQVAGAPFEDSYGLGFQVGTEANGKPKFFWHGGGVAGFYSHIVGILESGQGAVVLVNGKNSAELIQLLIPSIRKEYKWKL
jgi:CubicO group peptidase (beta-lactamase class C family)